MPLPSPASNNTIILMNSRLQSCSPPNYFCLLFICLLFRTYFLYLPCTRGTGQLKFSASFHIVHRLPRHDHVEKSQDSMTNVLIILALLCREASRPARSWGIREHCEEINVFLILSPNLSHNNSCF